MIISPLGFFFFLFLSLPSFSFSFSLSLSSYRSPIVSKKSHYCNKLERVSFFLSRGWVVPGWCLGGAGGWPWGVGGVGGEAAPAEAKC